MEKSAVLRKDMWAYCVLSLALCVGVEAQTTALHEWTWVGGSNSSYTYAEPSGVYGTVGEPSTGNLPAARGLAATWTDSSGNFWLFGGESDGYSEDSLNDLWEFNPSTNQWTWIDGSNEYNNIQVHGVYGTMGIPASSNVPGARIGASSWTDLKGNLWLWGGTGVDASGNAGLLNDLWEFIPSLNQWAWMGGSSVVNCLYVATCSQTANYGTLGTPASENIPGGRDDSARWVDKSGNLWMFGGRGIDGSGIVGYLNDLWEFNPSTNEWTWMGGSSTVSCPSVGLCSQQGVYGTLGTPAAGNVPGGRLAATGWTDNNGNFWLFGGAGPGGDFNDLWEFNPSLNEWAWMGGSSTTNQPGVYGVLGTPAASNVPGCRSNATAWIDSNGNFWLFGGTGPGQDNQFGYLNDLWEFNPSTTEWTWMDGSSNAPPEFSGLPGVYGTLGVAAAGNIPAGRADAESWTDRQGNLWLFGGINDENLGLYYYFNDLWEYQPLPITATPTFDVPAGNYTTVQTVTLSDATAGATIYYTTDGSTPTTSSTVYKNSPIAISSTETLEAIATVSGYSPSAVATAVYTITPPAATPNFSLAAGTYSAAQTVTISDATSAATIYYTTDGTAPSTASKQYSGPLTVSSTETIEAIAIASGYSTSAIASATFTINLPKDFSIGASPDSAAVGSGANATTIISVTPINGFNAAVSFACSGLPSGATCSFSPESVTPSGTPAVSTNLTIATSSSSAALRRSPSLYFPGSVVAVALCCFISRKRHNLHTFLLLALSIFGIGILQGCGGSGSPTGGGTNPPVTSTVTITATSGSLHHSADFSLTVN